MEVASMDASSSPAHTSSLSDPSQVFIVSNPPLSSSPNVSSKSVGTDQSVAAVTGATPPPSSVGTVPSQTVSPSAPLPAVGGVGVGTVESRTLPSSKVVDESEDSDDEIDDNLEIIVEGEEEEKMESSSDVKPSGPPGLTKAYEVISETTKSQTTNTSQDAPLSATASTTSTASTPSSTASRSSKECAKVKQFFTTLQTFANNISRDVAEQVQELITALVVSEENMLCAVFVFTRLMNIVMLSLLGG